MAAGTHSGARLTPDVQASTSSCETHATLANSSADTPAARNSARSAAAASALARGRGPAALRDRSAEMRDSTASSISKVVNDAAHLFPEPGGCSEGLICSWTSGYRIAEKAAVDEPRPQSPHPALRLSSRLKRPRGRPRRLPFLSEVVRINHHRRAVRVLVRETRDFRLPQ